jgi:hypothetical protein
VLPIKQRKRKLGNRLMRKTVEGSLRNNGKRKGESQRMKVITSSLLFLLLFGCSDSVAFEPVEPDVIRVELNPRLNVDDNGYYHLELSDNWQTLHRVSGTAYINDVPLEVLRVNWESSHYWYLGDTLGYIVNRYLTDDGIYVSVDTSYVVGFDGMEVPTINPASYSNSDGEVNTMIAPVQSMVGDTMTIRMYFWNNEYEIIDEVFYIVLN